MKEGVGVLYCEGKLVSRTHQTEQTGEKGREEKSVCGRNSLALSWASGSALFCCVSRRKWKTSCCSAVGLWTSPAPAGRQREEYCSL
jgi:hypothetical protein